MRKIWYLCCLSVMAFLLSGCQFPYDSSKYTSGLTFLYMEDTDSYAVSGYEGTESELVIPDAYQQKKVTSIRTKAFYNNEVITSVYVSKNVIEIGDDAFADCDNIVKATLPFISAGVEAGGGCIYYMYNPFGLSQNLKELIFLNTCTTIPDYACCWFENLEKVTLPSALQSIGKGAFAGCDKLKEINFYECPALKTIALGAFYNCSSLTEIDLSETMLTKIEAETFGYCQSVTLLQLPKGITEIGTCAFENMISMRSLNLSEYTSLLKINDGAFNNCHHLTSLVLPNSITYIAQDAFYDCERLMEIYNLSTYEYHWSFAQIPVTFHTSLTEPTIIQNVEGFLIAPYGDANPYCIIDYVGEKSEIKIPEIATGIARYGFLDSSKITKIDFSNCPDLFYIGTNAFWGSGVTELTIPASVSKIEQGAFSRCRKLVTLDMSACTSVERITEICRECYSLSKVILPDSIKKIGWASFDNCRNLIVIDYNGTLEQWGQVELEQWKLASGITTIHCLDGDYVL